MAKEHATIIHGFTVEDIIEYLQSGRTDCNTQIIKVVQAAYAMAADFCQLSILFKSLAESLGGVADTLPDFESLSDNLKH